MWKNDRLYQVRKFLIIFYLAGFSGMIIPATQRLFIYLIPYALLLNIAFLLFYHDAPWERKTVVVFLTIYLLGLLAEMAGVNTGKIFGVYQYGPGLGVKVYGTPLIIGINWLILTYIFASAADLSNFSPTFKTMIASAGMVLYDSILEQLAPHLDMWFWENGTIPFRNYLAWFLIAFILQSLLRFCRISVRNPLAIVILLCQFCFFLFLAFFFKIQQIC